MIEEEEEDNGPPEYIEPLGAALAQRGKKKTTGNADMSLSNPAFDTTDLWWQWQALWWLLWNQANQIDGKHIEGIV